MGIENVPGAIPSATYRGFSGPPHKVSDGERKRRSIALIGVGLALLLGLGAGLFARPQLPAAPDRAPMQPVRQTSGPELSIVVDHPAPAPIVQAKADRLEVLPAAMARAAPRPPPPPAVEAEPERTTLAEADDIIDCDAPTGLEEARVCRQISRGLAEDPPIDGPPMDDPGGFERGAP